jgi:hypothetical protein
MKNLLNFVLLSCIAMLGVFACIDPSTISGGAGDGVITAMAIPFVQHRGLFTKKIVAVVDQVVEPMAFLRSFFTEDLSLTKEVSIEVRRGKRKVAVDVLRGADGVHTTRTKSTETIILPPYYYLTTTLNDTDLYEAAMGSQNPALMSRLIKQKANDVRELIAQVETAEELQCAQVLQTGQIQLNEGVDINYGRKAASIVDGGASTYWTDPTVNPRDAFKAGANFLKTEGKLAGGGALTAILGEDAYEALIGNPKFQAASDIKDYELALMREPQRESTGGVLQGRLSAGSYKFNIWTYPEVYDTESASNVPYIAPHNLVIIPSNPKFLMTYGAVPQIMEDDNSMPQKGKYLIQDFKDKRKGNHEIAVKSAPVAVPVMVDHIYTQKVA